MKKYIAELIGTFALSFVVLLAVVSGSAPVAVPVIAGLTLALFVYTIGPVSGCHINPSVTIAQLSVKKISVWEAVWYIIAQLIGAWLAVTLAGYLHMTAPVVAELFSGRIFFAEMMGAVFFNFGIAAVVYGKAKEQMSGLVIGGSLLFGILVASLAGAAGILNPAVAIALNAQTVAYLFAPIAGAVLGFHVYRYVVGEK